MVKKAGGTTMIFEKNPSASRSAKNFMTPTQQGFG
jgi:hypothetical protein